MKWIEVIFITILYATLFVLFLMGVHSCHAHPIKVIYGGGVR